MSPSANRAAPDGTALLMNSPSFGQNTNDFGRRQVLLSVKLVW
jgi:hypothetical protein